MHSSNRGSLYVGCGCCCLMHRTRRLEDRLRRVEQQKPPNYESLLKALSRTLLLTGDGTRLDGSIREAIGWYVEVQGEIQRIERHAGLAPEIRNDVVVGFHRMLSRIAEYLARLDVKTVKIPAGTKLQEGRFRVVDRLETDADGKLNTVVECVQPEFTWVNGYGTTRIEPAHVRAYTRRPAAKPEKKRKLW